MGRDYEYDIALSFLGADEETAKNLHDRLRPRFKVFFYAESQKELVGKDGERLFSDVFGKKARTVVVIFRAGWGDARWTMVEANAIRNRAFDATYDFVIFVAVDPKQSLPNWVPKNRIWFDLQRFGVEKAADVISARATELGGVPVVEDAVAFASRRAGEARKELQMESLFNSGEGVSLAKEEHESFCREIESKAKAISSADDEYRLVVTRRGRLLDVVQQGTYFGMGVEFRLEAANTLRGAQMIALIETRRIREGTRRTDQLFMGRYDAILDETGTLRWQAADGDRRVYSTKDLADALLKTLVDRWASQRR